MFIQAIAVHTFVVVIWDVRPSQHIAYAVVGLTWIFIAFFIAMTVSIHTQGSHFYETPVGVGASLLLYCQGWFKLLPAIVLVLDRQTLSSRTICRAICLDLDHDVRFLPYLHPIILLGQGQHLRQRTALVES